MRCWSCDRENTPGVKFCASCGAGLACLDCGAPMSAGQRFCTNCGRRAPVRGAQTVVRRIERRAQETPHFRIHYDIESFAEQHIGMIGGRLENAYGVISGLLAIEPRAGSRIDVHLAEMLEDPQQPGQMLGGGGYAVPGRLEIREVFRSDAPGDGLERSLLMVLLTFATGAEASRPPFLLDGLLGCTMQRLGKFPPDDQVTAMLGGARMQRQLPPVAALLAGPTDATQAAYFPAVAGFTSYLLRIYGPERYKDLLRRAAAGNVDEALRAAYGRPLLQIEKAWHKTLKVAGPGGILRFLKLSWSYLRHYRLQVIEILLYIGIAVAFTNILARSTQWLVDRGLPGRDLQTGDVRAGDGRFLALLMTGLTAGLIVMLLTSLRGERVQANVAESVLREMRLKAFALIQRLEPSFFQRMQTGDILSRMTSDLAAIQFALTGALAQGLQIALTGLVAVGTVFWLDWKLASLAMLFMPLFFITGIWIGPAAARAGFIRQQHLADATSTLQENLAAQPVIKAFSLEELVTRRYQGDLDTLFRSSIRLTFLSSIFGVTAGGIASAIQLTVLGVGAWLIYRGNLTVGTLFAFSGLMGQVIGTVQSISGIQQALQQASGAMDRVDELLKSEPGIQDSSTARPLPPLARALQFDRVSFSYTGDQPTLKDLTLRINAGANVALVGPSGCGKSTVLNLIMRFYDAQDGRVSMDGVDLREAQLASLRGQMGVVFQENFLFNMSVRENIRFGRLDATDAEVERAARDAEIHEMIMAMPEGYDTLVGERGGRLSGGQRQRIAIARAILRNPAILLLDEATSALDPRTESAINETLGRLSRGRTTIAVTHRLASIAGADRIYVLDRGMLAEEGTHDQLIERNGLYARLWQEQGGYVVGAGVQYVGVEAARLQAVPLLAQLDGDLIAALAQRLSVERFSVGDVIINEGDVADKLYILHKGQVEVLAYDPAGRQRPINTLREGEHFGETALLFDVPRTATIRALTPVQLYSLSKEDFYTLLAAVPGLRGTLEQVMTERTRASARGG